ncbi:MAG: hypothetical protein ABIQ88_16160 [Chitinophagaceae bacterium]
MQNKSRQKQEHLLIHKPLKRGLDKSAAGAMVDHFNALKLAIKVDGLIHNKSAIMQGDIE